MDRTLHYQRHRFLWRLAWWPVWLWLRLVYNYHAKTQPIQGPALIVSNHVTDYDPFFLAITIKNPAYFVASSHVFAKPRTAKLIRWAQDPIGRVKGDTAGDTALTAVRRLRRGFSVALFPEGNRTFNGATADIVESTAKLARMSGASLVTHRFKGGYLTSPRWSGRSVRRGLFTGEIVNVYTPAQLKAMTPAQIADAIRADIYEDAYATQREWKIPYKGKNLAEHVERTLCLCPVCGELGALESTGDTLTCKACGLTAVYTPEGYLEGEKLPFRTVLEWDRWQAGELQKRADDAGDSCLAQDTDMELVEVGDDYTETPVVQGRMAIFRDRLELAGRILRFSDVTGMSLNGPQSLILTAHGRHYTVKSRRVRNLRKYLTLYHAVTAPDKLMSL